MGLDEVLVGALAVKGLEKPVDLAKPVPALPVG